MFCTECGDEAEAGARFCASCGAPFSDDDPLRPPKDAVPVAPAGAATREPDVPPPAAGSASASSSSARSRTAHVQHLGPKLLVAGGAIAVAVVLVVLLNGLGAGAGGADTPAGAVQSLVRAAQKEDPAAALATMDPDEANAVADLYSELRGRIGDALVRSDGGLEGVRVGVRDLRLQADDLGHGVAKVTATSGRLSAAFRGAGVPSPLLPRGDYQGDTGLSGDRHEYVMARRRDGGWFVSPLLTLLQQLVDYGELPQPDFSLLEGQDDASTQPAADAQQLVRAIARAITNRSVDGLLDVVSERELGPLRAYRPALQDVVSRIEGSADIKVGDTDLDESSAGSGRVRLEINRATLNATLSSDYSGEQAEIRLNRLCLDVSLQVADDFHGCDSHLRRVFGIDEAFIIADRVDGGLRLAPIATAKAYLDALLDNVGTAGVKRLAGTVLDERPSSMLTAGASAEGRLNEGGYAVHAYRGRAGELLAVEGDRSVALIRPDGSPHPARVCQNGTALYELDAGGTYTVLVTGARYESADYRVAVERVTATRARVPSTVSGTVGDRTRLAVLAFEMPFSGAQFTTDSPVVSSMVRKGEGSEGGCTGVINLGGLSFPQIGYFGTSGILATMVGPDSLLIGARDEPPSTPDSGSGSAYGYAEEADDHLLVVTGGRGARFTGSLEPTPLSE